MTTLDKITALKPAPEAFESEWSTTTLTGILADRQDAEPTPRPWWRRSRRRLAAVVASGVVALSAGAAVAGGGPVEAVRDAILDFSQQPNTTGNGLGVLDDPTLVAQFDTPNGVFAIWVATSSTGKVCYASSDGVWDGVGTPTRSELEYGCGGEVLAPTGGDKVEPLTRPDQLGGFFKDTDGPIVYGVSPYPDAVRVRVRGEGVDRTLPVRPDSHGYGAAVPEASDAKEVTFTFLGDTGQVLGTTRYVAPVG